jgi:hypothetical protein
MFTDCSTKWREALQQIVWTHPKHMLGAFVMSTGSLRKGRGHFSKCGGAHETRAFSSTLPELAEGMLGVLHDRHELLHDRPALIHDRRGPHQDRA